MNTSIRRSRWYGGALLLAVLLAPPAAGQSVDTLFAQANEHYRTGSFEQAARLYETIISHGVVSGELQFNLGNSYYRKGEVGRAILAYERAARLIPSDEDVQHNLHLSRLRAVDRIDPVPEFFLVSCLRLVSEFVPVTRARMIFFALWAMLFGSLSALYLGRSLAIVKWSRLAFLATVPFALVAGIIFGSQSIALRDENAGIIISPTVTAKSSPDATGADAFVIHEGLKVDMATTVDGWTRITLADGKVGWVKVGDVERI